MIKLLPAQHFRLLVGARTMTGSENIVPSHVDLVVYLNISYVLYYFLNFRQFSINNQYQFEFLSTGSCELKNTFLAGYADDKGTPYLYLSVAKKYCIGSKISI